MNEISNVTLDIAAVSTALSVIPASSISQIVAADPDDILGKLAAKVRVFRADVSTETGRDEMRSLAYEIARSKTALVKIGKGLTEGWRASTKAVNAECSTIEERMDELRDQVRGPLTTWENAEKERVAGHEHALAAMVESDGYGQTETSAELRVRLDWLRAYPARDWREFANRAADTLANEIARTERLLAGAEKREAEAAELARLREAEAERRRQEAERARVAHEARIAAEAAAKPKLEAEANAERERLETLRVAAKNQARVEREAADARDRAERAERQREADAAAAEARAQEAARQAEQARIAAAEKAERDRLQAIEDERKRVADERAVEEAKAARRATNRAHQASINREIVEDLMVTGLSDEQAKAVVIAIASRQVRHVTVAY